MAAQNLLTRDNPVFESFAFYSLVLLLKLILVQMTVVYRRLSMSVYTTPEDVKFNDPSGKLKVQTNEVVERHRKAHLNDIENIIPFLFIGAFYVLTDPVAATATLLFQIFTAARIVHSIVYLGQVPQPARAISFFAGLIVMTYMGVITLMFFK